MAHLSPQTFNVLPTIKITDHEADKPSLQIATRSLVLSSHNLTTESFAVHLESLHINMASSNTNNDQGHPSTSRHTRVLSAFDSATLSVGGGDITPSRTSGSDESESTSLDNNTNDDTSEFAADSPAHSDVLLLEQEPVKDSSKNRASITASLEQSLGAEPGSIKFHTVVPPSSLDDAEDERDRLIWKEIIDLGKNVDLLAMANVQTLKRIDAMQTDLEGLKALVNTTHSDLTAQLQMLTAKLDNSIPRATQPGAPPPPTFIETRPSTDGVPHATGTAFPGTSTTNRDPSPASGAGPRSRKSSNRLGILGNILRGRPSKQNLNSEGAGETA